MSHFNWQSLTVFLIVDKIMVCLTILEILYLITRGIYDVLYYAVYVLSITLASLSSSGAGIIVLIYRRCHLWRICSSLKVMKLKIGWLWILFFESKSDFTLLYSATRVLHSFLEFNWEAWSQSDLSFVFLIQIF